MTQPFRWGDIDDFLQSTNVFELGGTVTQDGLGSSLSLVKLQEKDGVGHVEYYCDENLRVLVFDCAFRENRTFVVQDGEWIRLNFSLDISVDMAFGAALSIQEGQPSWRLIRVPSDDLIVEVVRGGSRLQWVTVCCKPDHLSFLAGLDADDLPFKITGAATPEDAVIYRPFPLSASLKSITANLIGGLRPRGVLGNAYVACKANELVLLALDHLLNDHSIESLQVRLSERDVEALHAARSILDRNLATPPTVKTLSQQVGVNRNKLFYGFKSLFGVSVSEHLQNSRIETGLRLVLSTEDPISDIAACVGFRHQCNFSTAFKARFGDSPLNVRAQARERRGAGGGVVQAPEGAGSASSRVAQASQAATASKAAVSRSALRPISA